MKEMAGMMGMMGMMVNTNDDGNKPPFKDKPDYDDRGRPKYDKYDKPIEYDNSKYPKYDKNGKPIEYGTIDNKTDYNNQGRPKRDKDGSPIEYDDPKYPKYDKNGNPIKYGKETKSLKVGDLHNSILNKKELVAREVKATLAKSSYQIEILESYDTPLVIKKNNDKKYAEANILGFTNLLTASRDEQDEGCDCLEKAYAELNQRRLNLEKLRIIFAHAMKKINAGIAFGDGVSAVHGVSALIWQKQKFIILKESIPTLNNAYDDKYAEMISALEENLREIDRCEAILGYENWYNHAGFIYYQFMADKYKRN